MLSKKQKKKDRQYKLKQERRLLREQEKLNEELERQKAEKNMELARRRVTGALVITETIPAMVTVKKVIVTDSPIITMTVRGITTEGNNTLFDMFTKNKKIPQKGKASGSKNVPKEQHKEQHEKSHPSTSTADNIAQPSTSTAEDITGPSTSTSEGITRPSTSSAEDITRPSTSTSEGITRLSTSSAEDITHPSTEENITQPSTSSAEDIIHPSTEENITQPSTSTAEDITRPSTSIADDITHPSTSTAEGITSSSTSTAEDITRPSTSTAEDITHPSTEENITEPSTSTAEDITRPSTSTAEDINSRSTAEHIAYLLTSTPETITREVNVSMTRNACATDQERQMYPMIPLSDMPSGTQMTINKDPNTNRITLVTKFGDHISITKDITPKEAVVKTEKPESVQSVFSTPKQNLRSPKTTKNFNRQKGKAILSQTFETTIEAPVTASEEEIYARMKRACRHEKNRDDEEEEERERGIAVTTVERQSPETSDQTSHHEDDHEGFSGTVFRSYIENRRVPGPVKTKKVQCYVNEEGRHVVKYTLSPFHDLVTEFVRTFKVTKVEKAIAPGPKQRKQRSITTASHVPEPMASGDKSTKPDFGIQQILDKMKKETIQLPSTADELDLTAVSTAMKEADNKSTSSEEDL